MWCTTVHTYAKKEAKLFISLKATEEKSRIRIRIRIPENKKGSGSKFGS
jgi:hypothetical protein